MSDFLQSLTAGANNQNQVYVQFILNALILRHEAARLGIRPSPSEIAERVRDLPAFRGDGGVGFKKITDFWENGLLPNGLGGGQVEQFGREGLLFKQIKQVL